VPSYDTMATERGEPPAEETLSYDTIATERGAVEVSELQLPTMAPERGEPIPAAMGADEDAATRTAAREQDDGAVSWDSLVLEEFLDAGARARLAEVAFARAALRRNLGTVEQLVAAMAEADKAGARTEEHLVAIGLVPMDVAIELYAEAGEPLLTCVSCLSRLSVPDRCLSCGVKTELGATARVGSRDRGTRGTVDGEGGSGGDDIRGFPSEGGRFAGYELLERLAEGGMGVVFRARELTLNRVVALKVLRGGAFASRSRRRRFLREAEAVAALHHPNIVPIHRISEHAGYPFYTMDYVEGLVLDRWARERKPESRQLAELMRTVSDAVHHFHLRGIIHRDLKPENVLVNTSDDPKVIDFGIAKKFSDESEASWTIEGDILGTPHYMAPEQAAGRVQDVDTRSDVYSLGAILYELLAEEPPFHGLPQAKLLQAIQEDDPKPLRSLKPDLDRDLLAIVGKALSKERERRYQSAYDLADDLGAYVENRPIRARPATLGYRLKKFVRRRLPQVIVASVVLLALLSLATASYVAKARERATVRRLLEQAQAADLERRVALLNRALALAPADALVQARLAAAEQEEKVAEERREADRRLEEERQRLEAEAKLAEERRKQEALEAKLARERLEREAEAVVERERAREEAEAKSQRQRRARAETLLAQAERAGSGLEAFSDLRDALVLAEGEPELLEQTRRRLVGRAASLAAGALNDAAPGLAHYWIREGRKAAVTDEQRASLEALETRARDLESGTRALALAQEDMRAAKWRLAHERLVQARERGAEPEAVDQLLGVVERELVLESRARLEATRQLLGEQRPDAALRAAREAVSLAPDSERQAVSALLDECAEHVARQVAGEVLELWQHVESRERALALLDQAAADAAGTPAGARLGRERAHRAALLGPLADHDLVYVPAAPERGCAAFYVQRHEVTNANLLRFVESGGYGDPSLFDPPAQALLATFLDGTPGGAQPGPRTWRRGGYGDASNAERPVCGLTWWEARAYARWLARSTGLAWRLPTAEEWEVAAGWDPASRRMQPYPWGEAFEAGQLTLESSTPDPVASNGADRSPVGAADLGGSVAEWVELADGGGGLKGAAFPVDLGLAIHLSKVRTTGTPGETPPRQLLEMTGLRLILEATP
jgi:hypothetical protein